MDRGRRLNGGTGRPLSQPGDQQPKATPGYLRPTISSRLKKKEVTGFALTQSEQKPQVKPFQATTKKTSHSTFGIASKNQSQPKALQVIKPTFEPVKKTTPTIVTTDGIASKTRSQPKALQVTKPTFEPVKKTTPTTVTTVGKPKTGLGEGNLIRVGIAGKTRSQPKALQVTKPSFEPVKNIKPSFEPVKSIKPSLEPIKSIKPSFEPVRNIKPSFEPIKSIEPSFEPIKSIKPSFEPVKKTFPTIVTTDGIARKTQSQPKALQVTKPSFEPVKKTTPTTVTTVGSVSRAQSQRGSLPTTCPTGSLKKESLPPLGKSKVYGDAIKDQVPRPPPKLTTPASSFKREVKLPTEKQKDEGFASKPLKPLKRPPIWLKKESRPAPEKRKEDVSDSKQCTRKISSDTANVKGEKSRAQFDIFSYLEMKKAIQEKKIFSIHGTFPALERGLRRRGWVKIKLPNNRQDELDEAVDDTIMHQSLLDLQYNEVPYFIWTRVRHSVYYQYLRKEQITNHQPRGSSFTTKVGLCTNLKNTRWFSDVDADTFFPRCYMLQDNSEKEAFIEDFKLTAAQSILKLVASNRCILSGTDSARKPKPRVILRSHVITTALNICESYLHTVQNDHIDEEPSFNMTKSSWTLFLQDYYKVIHDGAVIECAESLASECGYLLYELECVNPQFNIEGTRNIWIVKPGAKSRGRGIICMDRLNNILNEYGSKRGKDNNWVVQKYIEEPLLIYGTKFDVRQWFVVTDWNPLTIWFYRECYFRFSSRPYSCEDLDISIHVCNNSIQKYLEKAETLHPKIPDDNWTNGEFEHYLRETGAGNAWREVMVPGMKDAIIHAMQSSQDTATYRKNSFELYGADFMFGENHQPWLIEINSSPNLEPTTPAKGRLTARLQEDILRLVLDQKENPTCDVGAFELIFKQPAIDQPAHLRENLTVKGSAIKIRKQPLRNHPTRKVITGNSRGARSN